MMKRRDFILNSTVAAFGLLGSNLAIPQVAYGMRTIKNNSTVEFFGTDEFLTITELCNRIIPTDHNSAGAVEASVNFFIDKFVLASEAKYQNDLRHGLSELGKYTLKSFNKVFHKLDEKDQVQVLMEISKNEDKPIAQLEDIEKFFITIKRLIYDTYYRTPIGIHMEIKFAGNGYHQNFVGCK